MYPVAIVALTLSKYECLYLQMRALATYNWRFHRFVFLALKYKEINGRCLHITICVELGFECW